MPRDDDGRLALVVYDDGAGLVNLTSTRSARPRASMALPSALALIQLAVMVALLRSSWRARQPEALMDRRAFLGTLAGIPLAASFAVAVRAEPSRQ